MRIAFQWEHEQAKFICPNWRDGLRGAIEHIEKKHQVDWLFNEAPKKEYDWILTWCDSNSQFSKFISDYSAKRAIILTTNPHNHHNLQGFDIVFCESSEVYEECRRVGLRAVKAFGTDDKFFKPKKVKKDIEYFYPATFSTWKRQSEIAHLGSKLLCVGTIQPDGQNEYDSCVKKGVKTKVGYFPVEEILGYYRRAKNVIIPAVHGSERTVLESMSCNVFPIVTNPKINKKTQTYIKEYMEWRKQSSRTPREFIKKFYSAKKYADTIMKAMEEHED